MTISFSVLATRNILWLTLLRGTESRKAWIWTERSVCGILDRSFSKTIFAERTKISSPGRIFWAATKTLTWLSNSDLLTISRSLTEASENLSSRGWAEDGEQTASRS